MSEEETKIPMSVSTKNIEKLKEMLATHEIIFLRLKKTENGFFIDKVLSEVEVMRLYDLRPTEG